MLIISRKVEEGIKIVVPLGNGENEVINIVLKKVNRGNVKFGLQAASHVQFIRDDAVSQESKDHTRIVPDTINTEEL